MFHVVWATLLRTQPVESLQWHGQSVEECFDPAAPCKSVTKDEATCMTLRVCFSTVFRVMTFCFKERSGAAAHSVQSCVLDCSHCWLLLPSDGKMCRCPSRHSCQSSPSPDEADPPELTRTMNHRLMCSSLRLSAHWLDTQRVSIAAANAANRPPQTSPPREPMVHRKYTK